MAAQPNCNISYRQMHNYVTMRTRCSNFVFESPGLCTHHLLQAAGHIEPAALHYMDLAALSMIRGTCVSVTALRSNVYKGRCAIDSWESVLDDALASCAATLDIVPAP